MPKKVAFASAASVHSPSMDLADVGISRVRVSTSGECHTHDYPLLLVSTPTREWFGSHLAYYYLVKAAETRKYLYSAGF